MRFKALALVLSLYCQASFSTMPPALAGGGEGAPVKISTASVGGMAGAGMLAARSNSPTSLDPKGFSPINEVLTAPTVITGTTMAFSNAAQVAQISDLAATLYTLLAPLRSDPAFAGANPAVKTLIEKTIQVCLAITNSKTMGIATPAQEGLVALKAVVRATKDSRVFAEDSALKLCWALLNQIRLNMAT